MKSDKTLPPSVIRDLNGTIEREKAAMGYFITLYSMPNLIKESRKYGLYENKQFGHTYPKIQVVSIQDILEGKRMDLPISLEVLKKAEGKNMSKQLELLSYCLINKCYREGIEIVKRFLIKNVTEAW